MKVEIRFQKMVKCEGGFQKNKIEGFFVKKEFCGFFGKKYLN